MADIKKALENIAGQQRNTFIKKQRRKKQRRLVTELIQDYAEHSTLHGLRYMAEGGVATLQKVFWLLTFLGSLFVCGYYISNVYVKWRTSPVIVSIDEKLVSVEDVPFPSVTICPQIKSRATVYNISKESHKLFSNVSDKVVPEDVEDLLYDYAKFEHVGTLCDHLYHLEFDYFASVLPIGTQPKNLNSTEIKDLYFKVSPNVEDVIFFCKWRNQDCSFSRLITQEGICLNFNSVSPKELFRDSSALAITTLEGDTPTVGWNSETGYDDSEPSPYPEPGTENSAEPDLRLLLAANILDKDSFCHNEFTGFNIYLHNPLDVPQTSLYFYPVVENQATSLAVDVNIIKTSELLSHYEPKVRQCYFPGEKYLRFFNIYTAKNCQLECLTNETLKRCHCIGLHMPHYNPSTEICKGTKVECMVDIHEKLFNNRKAKISYKLFGGDKPNICECLPSCNDIQYDAQIMRTDYNFTDLQNIYSITRGKHKLSTVKIFFKKPLYTSMRRSELFGWTDFVANVGGLLGLFLGFSVLSLIEILYYLTVKICLAMKRGGEDNTV